MEPHFKINIATYSVTKFPSGELHIHSLMFNTFDSAITIIGSILSSDNLVELCLLVNAIRSKGNTPISLVMPYCAYSRQDRIANDGEALSIKVFTDIINSLKFNNVETWDNHSYVTTALINNCTNISKTTCIHQVQRLTSHKYDYFVSPDAGANKQIEELSISCKIPMLRADKVRNTKTGQITHTEVFCDDLKGATCLIIDDICQGGMTFVKLAEELKAKGAGDIHLYVTHGFFSAGLDALQKAGITQIFTTNSVLPTELSKNKLIKVL